IPRLAALVAVVTPCSLVLAGCPGTLDDPAQFKGDGSIACFDVPTELASNCTGAGCHNSKDKAQMMDLQSPGVATRLVNKPATECVGILVNPMSPQDSVLYKKLTPMPPCGAPMPSGKPQYDPEHLQCILDWIQSLGAGGGAGGGGGTGGAVGGSGG